MRKLAPELLVLIAYTRRSTMSSRLDKMRSFALIAVVIGGIGSIVLMFLTGAHPPIVIIVGFVVWVLAPWVILLLANLASSRWRDRTRVALYVATYAITMGSLTIYTYDVARPPAGTRAFWWVVVPPASVIIAVIVIGAIALTKTNVSEAPAPTNDFRPDR